MTWISSAIPRLYCWGLIEAAILSSGCQAARLLFPGFIAGASLKQQNARPIARIALAYSPALLLGPH